MERLCLTPARVFKSDFPGWAIFLGTGKSKRKTPGEWAVVAKDMARENGGKLQSTVWMLKNGFSGLDSAIRKHPWLFADIERNKHHKSHEELVRSAEGLAQSNKGILPSAGWLYKNKFSSVAKLMRRQPGLFRHIRQETPYGFRKTAKEWVVIAEDKARRNGGKLQSGTWLKKHGLSSLDDMMRKRPELFAHIAKERLDTKGRLIPEQGESL